MQQALNQQEKEIDEKLDRLIAANLVMSDELKANGIIHLSEFSYYQALDVSYGMNVHRPKGSKTRIPIINTKNQQSVFNSSQIAIIKKYDGGFDGRTNHWYIIPRSL